MSDVKKNTILDIDTLKKCYMAAPKEIDFVFSLCGAIRCERNVLRDLFF